jgi:retron-type reverse transcriptase
VSEQAREEGVSSVDLPDTFASSFSGAVFGDRLFVDGLFDSLDRTKLKELLQIRVADGSLMRLIGKCLHVGVLDGAAYVEPDTGTAQGSVLSPLLGNVYLHYVLDLWFEREVKPRLRGEAHLVRYADDFVMTFEHQDDARRVMDVLGKRMGRSD